MLQYKKDLQKAAMEALTELSAPLDFVFEISPSQELSRGDYSSASILQLAKIKKENPQDLAQKFKENFEKRAPDFLQKLELAGPGFLNFFIKPEAKLAFLADKFSFSSKFSGKKILLEHSSPNLFKPFHIGHMVNNSYGEALVRLLRATGAEVKVLSFPSDVSPGIAKAVWGIKDLKIENPNIEDIGKAYAHGSEKYKEDAKAKEEIDKLNEKIYKFLAGENEKDEDTEIYLKGKELSLNFFIETLKRLNSKIDDFIFESEAEKEGKKIVVENTPGVFELSDGAYIFRGSEKCNLFDNVFVNSQGFGTYLAKDLGLLKIKFTKYDFEKSITITDIEQEAHFRLLSCAASFINKDWQEKSLFLQHGRMRPKEGKFSSRLGNVPLALDLLQETTELVQEKMQENKKGDPKYAEKIALAALKYGILKVSMGKSIVWDKERATSFEGDSGPYLLYSVARVNSIFKKASLKAIPVKDENLLSFGFVQKMLFFDDVVKDSSDNLSPHKLLSFLLELAQSFSAFYANEKVLQGGQKEAELLFLIAKYRFVMEEGLQMLGIESVENM